MYSLTELGFMQGRLIDPPLGDDLDWFPFKNWKEEFPLAEKLSFDYIELVIDRKGSLENPIYSFKQRKKINSLFKKHNLKPFSCCINFIIDSSLSENNVLKRSCKIIEYLKEIGIQFIIIPLFGESNPDNSDLSLIKNLNILVSKAENLKMNILLESNIDTELLLNILSQIDNQSLGIVYDVGNATFSGKNINYDLDLLSEKIYHVHLKDKDRNGRNVLLGSGLVDFTNFFKLLIKYNYKGSFTLETSRGKEALPMAEKNLEFVRSNFK